MSIQTTYTKPTIISADELQAAGAMISKAISWERTVMNLLWQLRNNEKIKNYLQSSRLLVTFGKDGAVYIETKDGVIQHPAYLFLAHGRNESSNRADLSPEETAGYEQALNSVAGVPTLPGLNYCHEIAVLPDGNTQPPETFVLAEKDGTDEVIRMAKAYVLGDESSFGKLPVLEIGKLRTYDRMEIESFSIIRNALEDYKNSADSLPLTIAVFGSPGSGKSFGIKQIANELFNKDEFESETFNVSQFTDENNLADAFRWACKIKDEQKKLPLLFLDEFDSADLTGTALGWLKSYLAPMQDGEYYDKDGKQKLCKCIIVFAGATSSTFYEFRNPENHKFFIDQKGPDFVSRVKCFIDIAGPNPRTADERGYILRRAVLLKGFMKRYGINEIAKSIVQAMLLVPTYYFGARSMETIIKMSRFKDDVLNPSDLPLGDQMAAHVPIRAFTNLLLQDIIENSTEGEIAKLIHEEYCKSVKGTLSYTAWDTLSPHFKLSNINQAMSYREKLELIGCVMRPIIPEKRPVKRFSKNEILVMAKQEHDRWTREKLEDGWRYAPIRNNDKKLHPFLVPWEELSEDVQNRDKEPCANIIPILGKMGYGVYRK